MQTGSLVWVYHDGPWNRIDTKYKGFARTSKETNNLTIIDPNRLMLCGKTVAVCCENRTEHTDTVRTSQETHHVSATEPNRLMLCGETVAVCFENRTEHTDTLWAVRTSQETQIHCVSVWPECGLLAC
jgi:predicted molibdopterin-dependent oxidoreductase YjgC